MKLVSNVPKLLSNTMYIRLFFSFSFIFFAIVITAVTFIVHYHYEQKYLSKTIQSNANQTIKAKKNILSTVLSMQRANIMSLSKNEIFTKYLHSKSSHENTTALFEQIIKSHDDIMQIRYIDEKGMENIRLDRIFAGSAYQVIPTIKLQNKKNRYYFEKTSKAGQGHVWISKIDLNIENNEIQIPYVPTMRIATPVYLGTKFKGILITNLFMEPILNEFVNSDLFMISLLDIDGHVLVGKQQIDGRIFDFSWSRYLFDKVNKNTFLPGFIKEILCSYRFTSEYLFAEHISKDLKLSEELIIVLAVKKEKVDEIKENSLHKILNTLGIVLLISGPLGLLLAVIPSILAEKIKFYKADLNEKTKLFDEYLEAMNVNNIISKSDLSGKITYVNDNFCHVSGYTREEVIGKPHSLLRHPDSSKDTFKILWLTIQSGKTWKGILRNRKKDGGFYDVDIAIIPIKDSQNNIVEYLAIRHEITELLEQRSNLLTIASQDTITGSGNRFKIQNDIKKHLLNNIAVIDINGFSFINDFYGDNIGDEVIIAFGELLEYHLTNEFELYRLHSDKFAILNYTLNTEKFLNFITHLNTTMIEAIIETSVKEFDIVTTAGISSEPSDTILLTAEIANKHAKKINQKVLVYSQSLEIETQFEVNIEWTEKIKKALKEDRIVVVYQAIYNNKTDQIEKYESLVRLKDEDGNLISPFFFLDIAKATGQYIEISRQVVQKSFEMFKDKDMNFAINLTMEDISNKAFVEYLSYMIQKYNIAHKLVLEIVESEEITDFDTISNFTKIFKSIGCKIAIDDFGTGYSNFKYLIELDIDYVKIDGSLIKDINDEKSVKQIVSTIVDFAKKIECKTIAEFVSSAEILETMKELDLDYSQGYFIGVPDEKLIM